MNTVSKVVISVMFASASMSAMAYGKPPFAHNLTVKPESPKPVTQNAAPCKAAPSAAQHEVKD